MIKTLEIVTFSSTFLKKSF